MKLKKNYRLIVYYPPAGRWHLYGPYKMSFANCVLDMLAAEKQDRSYRVIHDSFATGDCLEFFDPPTPEEDSAYYARYQRDVEKFQKTYQDEKNLSEEEF